MSHFTVLVAAKNEDQLKQRLQPFHEYECTGTRDEYVCWVDDIHDENFADWQKDNKGYSTFKSYMQDYCGYQEINPDTGRYERLTNPNAKWDWWEVGGRWSGSLLLKDGSSSDFALSSDIDWERIKQTQAKEFQEKHSDFKRAFDAVSEEEAQAKNTSRIRDWFASSDIAKSLTRNNLAVALRCFAAADRLREKYFMIKFEEWTSVLGDFGAELEKAASEPLTFAFVDSDGKWWQRGQMGWWAVVTDEVNGYPQQFWSFVEGLPENEKLYVVDCHI